MHYGVTTWNIQDASMSLKLSALREVGFNAASFLYRFPPPDAQGEEQLGILLRQHDLFAVVHGAIGDCSQPAERERVLADIHSVAEGQWESLRILAMCFDPGYAQADNGQFRFLLEGTMEVLQEALDILGPLGIQVGLENWPINTDLAYFEAIAKRLSHPQLGILLDLGHLNIAQRSGLLGDLSAAEYIRRLPMPIWEVHVHDNDGHHDQHRPLGQGNTEVEAMAAALRERGFDGLVTVEVTGISLNDKEGMASLCQTKERVAIALEASDFSTS